MIDLNLPEPPIDKRECVNCHKRKGLKGKLIHWPSADCNKEVVKLWIGTYVETFSIWLYKCQYCRAVETKRVKKFR